MTNYKASCRVIAVISDSLAANFTASVNERLSCPIGCDMEKKFFRLRSSVCFFSNMQVRTLKKVRPAPTTSVVLECCCQAEGLVHGQYSLTGKPVGRSNGIDACSEVAFELLFPKL